MLDDWEENLAIITANRTKGDDLVITHLGDCLWKEKNEVCMIHIRRYMCSFLFVIKYLMELLDTGCSCSFMLLSRWTKHWPILWKCSVMSHWCRPFEMSSNICQPWSHSGLLQLITCKKIQAQCKFTSKLSCIVYWRRGLNPQCVLNNHYVDTYAWSCIVYYLFFFWPFTALD